MHKNTLSRNVSTFKVIQEVVCVHMQCSYWKLLDIYKNPKFNFSPEKFTRQCQFCRIRQISNIWLCPNNFREPKNLNLVDIYWIKIELGQKQWNGPSFRKRGKRWQYLFTNHVYYLQGLKSEFGQNPIGKNGVRE